MSSAANISANSAPELPKISDPMGVLRPCDYTTIKILSLNLCFFYQYISDSSLNERIGLEARLPKIINLLKAENPDILLLQEGRDTPNTPFRKTIEKICDATGLEAISQRNNPDPKSFIHVTLYNPKKFFHEKADRFYPRIKPEDRHICGDDFGGFGNQTTVNTFRQLKWKEPKPGTWSLAPDYDVPRLAMANQHLGLNLEQRLFHMGVIPQELNRNYPDCHLISAGDHNPLTKDGAGLEDVENQVSEQLKPLSDGGFTRLTTPPYHSQDKVKIRGSFVGFPSVDKWAGEELSKKEKGEKNYVLEPNHLGSPLDQVFYKGPVKGDSLYETRDGQKWKQNISFDNTSYIVGRFDGTDPKDPKQEEDYFTDHSREEFYSDHMAARTHMKMEWTKV